MTTRLQVVCFRTVTVIAVLASTLVAVGVLNARGARVVSPVSTTAFAAEQAASPSQEYLSRGDNGFFEVRIYPLKQNLIGNTYKFMNNVNTFQKETGMNIIGHFPDQDAGKYIWMRNYPNQAALDQRYRATYDSAVWKSGKLRGGITETGLAGSNVFLATATKYSMLQSPYVAKPESAMPGKEAKELAKLYAASADGDVPACGRCGSNPFIFEVTLHEVKPGMMDSYVTHMGENVFRPQEAKGIRVFAQLVAYAKVTSLSNGGTFVPENGTFISIRLFADEATRRKQEMAVGEDKEAVAKAAQAAGRAGLNTIVFSGHPSFYSQMQQ